jgi:2-succinyl-6-hydroxy-2,4-cyclohexadiene-1-carboxylate synthase
MLVRLDDITLNVEQAGAGSPLLLLHGFTGSAATWQDHRARFAPRCRTIAPDLIGHGRSDSPPDPGRFAMERCIADLLALLDALKVEHTAVLGYSMGGRVALHLAAAAPNRVRALILESGSPGIADVTERQARVAADGALAEAIELGGLVAFVDRWERLPLFASQAALPEDVRERLRAQRLQNEPRGLANSLRGMGTGHQEPLWDRLVLLDMPTLLIAGALDTKYCAIARQMAVALPNAELAIVPNAGHAVHLEQPDVFTQHVLQFLQV